MKKINFKLTRTQEVQIDLMVDVERLGDKLSKDLLEAYSQYNITDCLVDLAKEIAYDIADEDNSRRDIQKKYKVDFGFSLFNPEAKDENSPIYLDESEYLAIGDNIEDTHKWEITEV